MPSGLVAVVRLLRANHCVCWAVWPSCPVQVGRRLGSILSPAASDKAPKEQGRRLTLFGVIAVVRLLRANHCVCWAVWPSCPVQVGHRLGYILAQ